jgi:hypothetical protein
VRITSEDISVYDEDKVAASGAAFMPVYQNIDRLQKWAFKLAIGPHLVITLEHHHALGSED